jgi:hypothetical protein
LSGSWEQPEVLVGILTREIVTTKWAMAFRSMMLPPTGNISFQTGMPFDHARNTLCQRALADNYKWLMFIDDDVIMPPDTFARLSSHKHDIVSGLYYRRSLPIAPVLLRDTSPMPTYITDLIAPNVNEIDMCGTGCLLINTRVLRNVPRPWFEWKVDRDDLPPNERCSEDYSFCRKVRQYGFKIYVDTSVQCKHIGLGESGFGGSYGPASI